MVNTEQNLDNIWLFSPFFVTIFLYSPATSGCFHNLVMVVVFHNFFDFPLRLHSPMVHERGKPIVLVTH